MRLPQRSNHRPHANISMQLEAPIDIMPNLILVAHVHQLVMLMELLTYSRTASVNSRGIICDILQTHFHLLILVQSYLSCRNFLSLLYRENSPMIY